MLGRIRLLFTILAAAWTLSAAPAFAKVRITFWSQNLGSSFPHAFFTLDGTPDGGGTAVDTNFGFTAKVVSPALLWGDVPGRIDIAKPGYIMNSFAHFSIYLTDDQYRAVLHLVEEWGEKGDHHYSLNNRNCVHFAAEAARRSGLKVVLNPKLMKKPHSFMESVLAMNPGVIRVEMSAKDFYGQKKLARAG